MSMNTTMTPAQAAQNNNREASGSGRYAEKKHSEAEGFVPPTEQAHQTIVSPIFADVDKTERVKEMLGRLDAGVAAAHIDPVKWAEQVRFASRFRRYSFRNSMLIAIQCPGATHVASKNTWADAGGSIRKGAKAIWILAPSTYRKKVTDASGNAVTDPETGEQKTVEQMYFRPVPVYDISDIEGVTPPDDPWGSRRLTGEAPERIVEDMTSLLAQKDFHVTYQPIPGSANGYAAPPDQVVIDSGLDPRQQAKTLAHEAAHVWLGHIEPDRLEQYATHRGDMEAEAETVSFMLAGEYGMDDAGDYSFGYIAGWTKGDLEKSQAAASRAAETGRKMLEAIHPSWKPTPIPELVEARKAREEEWADKRNTRSRTTRRKPAAKRTPAKR